MLGFGVPFQPPRQEESSNANVTGPGTRCCSLAADEAEAVLVEAAGAVAGGEEVQLVDHVVVAACERLIDPCPLSRIVSSKVPSRNLPPCLSLTKTVLLRVNRIENEPPGM
jgi:hypothetical protein